MFLVQNERTKLTANWLNALATALVATAVFAPLAALLYGVSGAPSSGLPLLLTAIACFVIGVFLHMMARFALGRLRE
jgi:hypothetical protein